MPGGEVPAEIDEADYGTKLEEVFIEERGTPFLLLSKDWLLIRGWRERGIPLDTVIRAVRETFEKRRARGATGRISSISYCAEAVEERWELERRGLVGQHTGAEATPIDRAARLARIAELLEASLAAAPPGVEAAAHAKAAARALEKVRALSPELGYDQLEGELSAIEEAFARKLVKALAPEAAERLALGVAGALGDTSNLRAPAVERMRRALEQREVRRMLGLPPLTLFDA